MFCHIVPWSLDHGHIEIFDLSAILSVLLVFFAVLAVSYFQSATKNLGSEFESVLHQYCRHYSRAGRIMFYAYIGHSGGSRPRRWNGLDKL